MNLAEYIDSTNLSKIATADDIIKLCEEAKTYHFPCVIVPPYYVKASSEYLKDSTVLVGTVIGFPNGYQTKEVKQFEAINAIAIALIIIIVKVFNVIRPFSILLRLLFYK